MLGLPRVSFALDPMRRGQLLRSFRLWERRGGWMVFDLDWLMGILLMSDCL